MTAYSYKEKGRLLIAWVLALGIMGCDILNPDKNNPQKPSDPPKTSTPTYPIRLGTSLDYLFTEANWFDKAVEESTSVLITLKVTGIGDTGETSGSIPDSISYTLVYQGSHLSFAKHLEDPRPPISYPIAGKAHCTTFLMRAPATRLECVLDSNLAGLDLEPSYLRKHYFSLPVIAPSPSHGEMIYLSRKYPLTAEIIAGKNTYYASETGWFYRDYFIYRNYNTPVVELVTLQLMSIDGTPVEGPPLKL